MTDVDASSIGPFADLDTMRWLLEAYLRRGDRSRLLTYRRPPAAVREVVDDTARPTGALLQSADRLARQVQHTNAVVSRWLLAHRVVTDPTEDPLHALVRHVRDVLTTAANTDDDAALERLRAQLTLPLHAVHRELDAAAVHRAVTVRLVGALSRGRHTVDESGTYAS